jgi:4-hydroxy-tetrahydrodipicolinate synthase
VDLGIASRDGAGPLRALEWDVGDLATIDPNVARIEGALGPVDILMNNTGVPGAFARRGREAPKLTHAESVEVVRTVCARTDLPVVVGVSAPGFGSMKHEDWPGLEKITALRVAEESGEMRPLSILCGNGRLFVDFEMSRGADGAMTGYCFPEMLVDVVRLQRERLVDDAHDLFDAHLPLVRYEQQTGAGLAVRKHVMVRRSLLASDAQRAPGRTLTGAERAEVDYLLTRLARRDPRAKVA